MSVSVRQILLSAALVMAVLGSAFAVISSTHQSRGLYAQLQDIEAERWYLEEEYSRLLLEQGTWASHHRIAMDAESALGLDAPGHDRTRLVTP